MSEIIFEVSEDEVAGGYVASALGYGIHTEAETLEELRGAVREALDCYFDETMGAHNRIKNGHFVGQAGSQTSINVPVVTPSWELTLRMR